MFQIPSLALRVNPRVWGVGCGQHVWNVPPTAPFPHAVKRKKKNAFANTAPAESPRSPQQSASGSAALAHPQSVARFVSTSTPPESPSSRQHAAPGSVVPEHPRSAQYVHVHPCCRLTPVRALQTTLPATISTISSLICGTDTSTICSWICSLMTATARLQQRVEDRVPDAHL